MKTFYALVLLLPATALAQPVITASVQPQPGDQCRYLYYSDNASFGTGPDQYWDFAGYAFSPSFVQNYVDPLGTAGGPLFPGSNVAYVNATQTYYEYYTTSPTSWIVNGIYSTSGTYYDAVDPMEVMHFPWTYGTVHEDAYLYVANDGSEPLQDTLRWNVDTYGTVRLPGGTELPVVGAVVHNQTVDTTEMAVYTFDQVEIRLYAPDVRCRVATITMEYEYTYGVLTNFYSNVRALDDATIGLAETAAVAVAPVLWPVPTQGTLNVRYALRTGARVDLRVIDATGRVVSTQRSGAAELSNGASLDVSGLAPGTYLLQLLDAGFAVCSSRFVVE